MITTLLNQAVIMLILICLGILCYKIGIISESGSKELSRLALLVINPIVIFMAYQKKLEARLLKGFAAALLLGVISFFIAAIISHGVIMMSGQKSMKNIVNALTSSSVIAICLGFIFFMTGLRLPGFLGNTLDLVGSMNTPVAMIVAGATIARTNILKALKNPRIYYITFLTLILIPAVYLLIKLLNYQF